MRYVVVIEKAEDNYSAYVPDLPGCVATGATIPEVETEIREAIRFHIDGSQGGWRGFAGADEHRGICRGVASVARMERRRNPGSLFKPIRSFPDTVRIR